MSWPKVRDENIAKSCAGRIDHFVGGVDTFRYVVGSRKERGRKWAAQNRQTVNELSYPVFVPCCSMLASPLSSYRRALAARRVSHISARGKASRGGEAAERRPGYRRERTPAELSG